MPEEAEAKEIMIYQDKKLTCPICNGTEFLQRYSQMNTAIMTFFKLDWMNKSALNYICSRCAYVFWFFR